MGIIESSRAVFSNAPYTTSFAAGMEYRQKLVKLLAELQAKNKSPDIIASVRRAIQEYDKQATSGD